MIVSCISISHASAVVTAQRELKAWLSNKDYALAIVIST